MKYKNITIEDIKLESSRSWVFDIEVFNNYTSFLFKNLNDKRLFEVSEWKGNEIDKLLKFLDNEVNLLYSYNGKHYDLPILYKCKLDKLHLQSSRECNRIIKEFSDLIINSQRGKPNSSISKYKKFDFPFVSPDLKEVRSIMKGLKLVGVSLKHDRLQETPIHFDTILKESDIPLVLDYNENDDDITIKLALESTNELIMRLGLSNKWGVNLLESSDSHIGNEKFLNDYSKLARIPVSEFINKRTIRNEIKMSDVIVDEIQFKTPLMKKILEKSKKRILKLDELESIENEDIVKSVLDVETIFSIKKDNKKKMDSTIYPKFKLGKLDIKGILSGGLHSVDTPLYIKPNENELIRDADVTSFYPKIVCNTWHINGVPFKIKPEHLTNAFNEVVENIMNKRIEAKRNKENVEADGLKISVNGIFGKLGFKGFCLFDIQSLLQVTVNGQFFLLMLIEECLLNGIEGVSANTDGFTAIVPKDKLELYQSICKEWEKKLNFNLEFVNYNLIVRRDVNNYLAIQEDGKVKTKGCFNFKIELNKGYDSPIVSKSLYEHYVNGKDIDSFILNHKDIHDFCIANKIGEDYVLKYGKDTIQSNVRFIVSNKGKSLLKTRINKDGKYEEHNLCKGYLTNVINNIPENLNEIWNILNFDYYIKEAKKIKNKIENFTEVDGLF